MCRAYPSEATLSDAARGSDLPRAEMFARGTTPAVNSVVIRVKRSVVDPAYTPSAFLPGADGNRWLHHVKRGAASAMLVLAFVSGAVGCGGTSRSATAENAQAKPESTE